MKKLFALILCAALTVGTLCGCQAGQASSGDSAGSGSTQASGTATAEAVKSESSGSESTAARVSESSQTELGSNPAESSKESAGAVSYNDLDETDQNMLQMIALLQKACDEHQDEIWGGLYQPQNLPLMMVRADDKQGSKISGAFAFHIEKFDADMNPVPVKDIPAELGLEDVSYLSYQGSNAIEKDWENGYEFSFYDLQGVHGMYVKYYPDVDQDRCCYNLTHEAFHEYVQVKYWKNCEDLTSVVEHDDTPYTEDVVTTEMMVAGMMIKSVSITDPEALKALMSDVLVLKQYIYDQDPLQKAEIQGETLEGSPDYVADGIENLMKGRTFDDPQNLVDWETAFLGPAQWQQESNKNEVLSLIFYKDLYYSTGRIFIMTMDRLGIPYLDALDKEGKLVWDCMMEYCYPDGCTYDAAQIEQLKETYGYNKYVERGKEYTEILNTTDEVLNIV